MDQNFLDQAEFADNPEPRCPVVLVLDTSGSMKGEPITELNQGLFEFGQTLRKDRLTSLRVEVALVTFGGRVRVVDVRGERREALPASPNMLAVRPKLKEIPFDAR